MNMKNYTREDILNLVEEEDVGFIRLQFTDIFGTMKNVAITVSQLKRALDNKCMFDGSSIEGFARIEESDMYLHPDLNTFEIFPWRPQQDMKIGYTAYDKDGNVVRDIYFSVPMKGTKKGDIVENRRIDFPREAVKIVFHDYVESK